MRCTTIIVLAAMATLLAIKGWAQQPVQDHGPASDAKAGASARKVVMPDTLKWEDFKSLPPGAKMAMLEGDPTKEGFIAFRIKLPANYKVPPHYHPCPERVTVLSGTLHLGMGEKVDQSAATALTAGSYTSMPPQMRHFAWTESETVLQMATIGPWGITYVNPSDDPRKR
jgi:quercetin dioxygenase-like cupin family protein